MANLNLTPSSPSNFILNGIPDLEAMHIWISIPLSMFYMIILLGNFLILLVVSKEQTLRKPMYLLICMLAVTDIGMPTCVMPKALGIFWFGFKEITVNVCFTQMFFFHVVTYMHSAVLVMMAFDRYVAVCNPLRYTIILTNGRTALLGLIGLIRAFFFIMPLPFLLQRLPFCTNFVIPHTFCEHIAVLKISCGDTSVNRLYSLVIAFVITGLDLTLIGLSYGLIIRAVLRISSKKMHQKALNTCTAHICVILLCYAFSLFSALTHRFGQSISAHFHILFVNISVLVPPMLNPIIYAIKIKELRDKMGKYICRM